MTAMALAYEGDNSELDERFREAERVSFFAAPIPVVIYQPE
jgi:hypothetical protein